MRERLSGSEQPKDFLGDVLRAASRTKTLVFNAVRGFAGDPNDCIAIGTTFILGGLLNGVAHSISAVRSPISNESLAIVIFYAGFVTGASVALGIGLIRNGVARRQTNLSEFNTPQTF